jgi:hypothetical protein
MRKTTCFAHKRNHDIHPYIDIYGSETQVYVCDFNKENPIIKVTVIEDQNGNYWAWWDNEDQAFCMVWQSHAQLEVCFPYGINAAEERGRGEACRVRVEEGWELE